MMEMVRNSTSTKTNCAAKLRSELLTSSSWWAVWDCKGCVEASIADAGGQQPELCRLAPAVAACLSRVPGTWWTYSGGLLKGWWMSSLFSCVTSGLRRRGLYLWTLEANGRNCAGWHAAAAAQPRLGLFCSDESARTGWSRESTAADWAEKQTGGWWNRLAKQVLASCAINIRVRKNIVCLWSLFVPSHLVQLVTHSQAKMAQILMLIRASDIFHCTLRAALGRATQTHRRPQLQLQASMPPQATFKITFSLEQ